ncbi:MAG TPA: YbhB/YbcL family Raf kinase inhibitor-like protein [Smithella sp.]|nr:YbhB/YbcL family Raf kinase inhibitor-like protein [Smithella sp.]
MKYYFFCFSLIFCFAIGNVVVVQSRERIGSTIKGGKAMEIKSLSFQHENMIPAQYTCDGRNVSPPLSWSGAPDKTKSFALICDDPDAPVGLWVHWVLFDIPASVNALPENFSRTEDIPGFGKNGKNTSGRFGYDGPCPPDGTHRYYFKLYALDTMLNLKPGLTKDGLLQAIEGHVLAEAQLMSRYKRPAGR